MEIEENETEEVKKGKKYNGRKNWLYDRLLMRF